MAARSDGHHQLPRLEELSGFVLELAAGRLDARLEPSPVADEIDAIIVGLNMLAEELQGLTHELEARVADRTKELAAAQRDLERLALYDPLTGLANRHLLTQRIADARSDAVTGAAPAVLVLDLDGFKAVNDSFGHPVGDQLLVAVAQRLRGVVRDTDTVSRLGGDEFAIVVRHANRDQVLEIAERVRTALAEPVALGGRTGWIGASVGVRFGTPGLSADEFLRDADLAMYTAKARCRGGVAAFEPSMHTAALSRTQLADEIRTGLGAAQLTVLYQPIIDVEQGRPVAVEALVRWNHPTRGLLGPEVFVPVAEDLGLIAAIDRWVLRTALDQLARWQEDRVVPTGFGLHVNMSPVDLRAPRAAEEVLEAVAATGIAPGRITVEISERRLAGDDPGTMRAMETLRSGGVRVAMDDFGSGTSSLGLSGKTFIDVVKIDGGFLRGLDVAPRHRRVAAAVVEVVDAFGVEAIAVGIAGADEAAHLHALGIRYAQGRHYTSPTPAGEIGPALRRSTARTDPGRA